MAVISCAVAGIGLGAFLASRWPCESAEHVRLVLWRHDGLSLPGRLGASAVAQPVSAACRPSPASSSVRATSLLGHLPKVRPAESTCSTCWGRAAVVLTVLAYQWLASEAIFLGLVTLMPLIGGVATVAVGDLARAPASVRWPRAVRSRRHRWAVAASASDAATPCTSPGWYIPMRRTSRGRTSCDARVAGASSTRTTV